MSNHDEIERVAIIGMSGAFPGARNIGELWELLLNQQDGISTLTREQLLDAGEEPETIDDPRYVPRGGFVDEAEEFDAPFFGFSPSEALALDPQQRLFLAHSRLALEDAGVLPEAIRVPVGVFAGESPTQYWFLLKSGAATRSLDDFKLMLSNDKDFLATRTSYKLNLKGPSLDVQSACSTSLAAVALACQSLLAWNCDLALAGGATVTAPRKRGYTAYEGMIASPSGVCRPFDASADGTLFGEGVGVVCLKRLSEARAQGDFIYAIIDAVAMNNDGADKVGFTAPSVNGQADVVEMAQSLAEVTPRDIGYVEAHGTATALGDPIEVQALTQAFRRATADRGFCYLGSIKANVGHLDATAGIAALIKTALVVHTGVIPPQRNYSRPNPHLDLESTPFVIPTEQVRWQAPADRRIAGVSSFGIGGTNVHAILEAPGPGSPRGQSEGPPLLLSAKTAESLKRLRGQAAELLRSREDLSVEAVVAKLMRVRPDYPYRAGFMGNSRAALVSALEEVGEPPRAAQEARVLFAFPGQGSQFPAMAKAYYRQLPTFTQWIDRGVALAQSLGLKDLRRLLLESGEDELLAQTSVTQPLLYVIQVALAREIMARGVSPSAVTGHSVGEYAAAVIAGALDYEDGLWLVWQRGQWMQKAPGGGMVAFSSPQARVTDLLDQVPELSVCVRNSTSQVVLGGPEPSVIQLESLLAAQGIEYKRLKTSHAFHSPMMDSIVAPFAGEVRKVRFRAFEIPFLSSVDGVWRTGDFEGAEYWVNQLRQGVRFDSVLATLSHEQPQLVVEIGPGRTLTSLVHSALESWDNVIPLLVQSKNQASYFEAMLIQLWQRGARVSWPATPLPGPELILYPGYPFDRQRFWPGPIAVKPAVQAHSLTPSQGGLRDLWIEILGHDHFDHQTSFFLGGADSFAGIQLLQRLRRDFGLELTMAQFMAQPTMEALEARLKGVTASLPQPPISTYLFPVQTQGHLPPLFIVAGAHENRYFNPTEMRSSYEEDFYRYFGALIGHLGVEQPLYGFRPKGLVLAEPLHTTVSAMVDAYLIAIKAVQPHGPYYIGGECVGGVVALEMACRLEAEGEIVGRLFLLDTPRPTPWVSFREQFLLFLNWIRWSGRAEVREFLRSSLNSNVKKFLTWLPYVLATLCPVTDHHRQLRRALTGSRRYLKTLLSHTPRAFHGPVTYIINRVWNHRKYMMGWSYELGPNLEVHEVPGLHESRLRVSGQRMGAIIREALKKPQPL